MAGVGQITVGAVLKTGDFSRGIRVMQRELQTFGSAFTGAFSRIAGLIGVGGTAGIIGFGVRAASEFETARVGLSTMLASVERADNLLSKLDRFAAGTPFQFGDIAESAQVLLSFGVAADDVMGRVQQLGDVAAGSNSRLIEVVRIFGKVQATQRLTLENVNQLAERGIPIYAVLQKMLGKTADEIRTMASAGELSSQVLISAFQMMTGEGGIFFNAMVNQSQTLAGKWSTLKDNAEKLSRSIGQGIRPAVEGLLDKGAALIDWVQNLDRATVQNVLTIGSMVAGFAAAAAISGKVIAAISSIVKALRAMATAQTILKALSGPAGIASLVVGLTAAAAAGIAVNKMFDAMGTDATAAMQSVEKATSKVTQAQMDRTRAIEAQIAATKKLKEAQESQAAADAAQLQRANEIYQSMKSPAQVLQDQISEIQRLVAGGYLNDVAGADYIRRLQAKNEERPGQFSSGIQERPGQFSSGVDSLQKQFAGLALRGTHEAAKMIAAAEKRGEKRGEKIEEKQLDEAKTANDHLEVIAELQRGLRDTPSSGGDITVVRF